jgi:hypothetical protein
MTNQQAEAAGSAPPEDSSIAPLAAVPLYGTQGWRSANAHLFSSDASLRWAVDQNREELAQAGALALISGRICAVEPTFSILLLDIAKRALGFRSARREEEAAAARARVTSALQRAATN